MTFRPGTPLTITVAVCLVILIGLGTWQARKVGPKTAMVEAIRAGMVATEEPLAFNASEAMQQAYRRVSLSGRFVQGAFRRIYGMNGKGKPGYHLYGAIIRSEGPAVIVAAGWVQMDDDRLFFPVSNGESLTLKGLAAPEALPGMMTPANKPQADEWFVADVDELAASFGLTEYLPVRVILDGNVVGTAGVQHSHFRLDIPNNHFQYALTWYGIGLALVGVYVAFGLKRGRDKQE